MNTSRNIGRAAVSAALAALTALTMLFVAPVVAQKKKPDVKQPKTPSFATLLRGRRVFAKNCVQCHGGRGTGDGAQGRGLKPPPAVRRPGGDYDSYIPFLH